ncbi:hypothetical protein SAMN03159304_03114 [Pseudomonas sp. NFACC24-1]|uniref:hypothetical protein n=1 Tax=Pseudomonas sp. NFACC24-1 TaxID=1566189 RepID=UPI0008E388C3|nr:hypothetical protein [Pseudomonas sp. NFACC24-1]SFO39755.1 hypothetical protein SAMN03159304_03114 [Pseudomonas sp. NFACC24-1]
MGACEISPNYFDPRKVKADATAPIPWNGFPRALDRWHKVLSNPTPDKQAEAEATADVVIENFFWWENGKDGKPALRTVKAHLAHLLDPTRKRLARRARLGSGSGTEVPICYRQQDEYVEWHADRDDTGKLIRLSFTAEPPEYWTYIAEKEPELVLKRYQELVGPQVERDDLFFPEPLMVYGEDKKGVGSWLQLYKKGRYNGFNKWNSTDGVVHLTHWANTLGAEINLAAVASRVCQADIDGPDPAYDDDPALTRIACAGYGAINRSSDPSIGEQVGIQISAGNRVSLTDPIGLYIGRVDLSTLERETPAGRVSVAEKEVLTLTRGTNQENQPRKLHIKLEAPVGANWALGDCFLDNRPLKRGGQVARKITMVLYADVKNGGADQTVTGCREGLICRNPDSPGFFGTFEGGDGRGCSDLTKDDWSDEIPNVGTSIFLKAKLTTFGVKVDKLNGILEELLPAQTETAPVGDDLLIAPDIPSNRAKMP